MSGVDVWTVTIPGHPPPHICGILIWPDMPYRDIDIITTCGATNP